MPDAFDKEFFELLNKHFGESWSHEWETDGEGFYIKLRVWAEWLNVENDAP